MISYQRLFDEIERYTTQARNTKDEQQLRELFSAIRALCDVALNKERHTSPTQALQQVGGSPVLHSTKLEEDDANGDSIFDF